MTTRTGEDRAILWVAGENGRPSELQLDVTRESNYLSETCTAAEVDKVLDRMAASGTPPFAVVIDSGVEKPLRAARQSFRQAAFAQIVFLVGQEHLAQFRAEMSIAPMIGTHWSIIAPERQAVLAALDAASRVSRQRRSLRTNLESINLRLSGDRPPRDSSEYRKLVISDRYLATILEHAQDAIVSLDSTGRIASWNRGAQAIFGYDEQDAAKLRLDDLIVPGKRDAVQQWFRSAVAGDPVVQMEADCLRKSGQHLVAEVTFAPIRDGAGELVAISLTARDITLRKRDEEELKRIRLELEERVAQRTQDLQSVNQELEAFTYSASHDLRAPLRGIDGFSQALLEDYADALDETADRYIQRIRAAAARMGDIIDSLLMLSRISRADLQVEIVDVTRMAREIVAELKEREPERQVAVTIHEGLEARADEQLIHIAVENLLSNAWKFTGERERAEIEVGKLSEGEGETFFVRDNGAGFDMSYVQKLFEPFQRLHHPVRFEGTGIGLGTVHRVISRHGGRVWAQSEPDAGATFYFTLSSSPVQRMSTQVHGPS